MHDPQETPAAQARWKFIYFLIIAVLVLFIVLFYLFTKHFR